MNKNTFFTTTVILFAVVSSAHLFRVIFGWEVSIGGWQIPLWLSWIAFLLAGFLSWTAFRMRKK